MKSIQKILKKKKYIKIKLKKIATNHLELKAKINGVSGRFILDTGASNSCVGLDMITYFNLDAKESETKGNNHSLADKEFLTPSDFSQQVLLTYPVKAEQLDIFKLFLNKASNTEKNYQPKAIKQVANSHMILQMVAANMGIATLPNWLVNSLSKQALVQTKRIGEKGIFKTLYARFQTDTVNLDIIEQLIPQAVAAFDALYHTVAIEK